MEFMIKTIEDEITSANLLNEEHRQPPQINAIMTSVLSTSHLKKRAREKVALLDRKKTELVTELKRLVRGGDAFDDVGVRIDNDAGVD